MEDKTKYVLPRERIVRNQWLLIASIVTIVALGFVFDYFCLLGVEYWLSRSGAVCVTLSLISLFIDDRTGWLGGVKGAPFFYDHLPPMVRRLKNIELCILSLGTLIWAFGDLASPATGKC